MNDTASKSRKKKTNPRFTNPRRQIQIFNLNERVLFMEKTVTEHPWGFFRPTIKTALKSQQEEFRPKGNLEKLPLLFLWLYIYFIF